jgi:hypothetical protein
MLCCGGGKSGDLKEEDEGDKLDEDNNVGDVVDEGEVGECVEGGFDFFNVRRSE